LVVSLTRLTGKKLGRCLLGTTTVPATVRKPPTPHQLGPPGVAPRPEVIDRSQPTRPLQTT